MTIKVPSTLADELESKMRARQACKTEAAADTFTHEIGLLICGEPEAILTALRASPVIDREAVLEEAAKEVEGLNGLIWASAAAAAIRALKSIPVTLPGESEASIDASPVGDDRGEATDV